ncbi:MAG: hypothetical protein H6737_14040 [Alphaproteobacteria bacterium]|nr:hypothetical protein [Alphaproteobacteria bacterium]
MAHRAALAAMLAAAPAWAAPVDRAIAYHGDFIVHPGASGRLGWSLAASERTALVLETQADVFWHPRDRYAFTQRVGPCVRWRPGAAQLGAFLHAGVQEGVWASPTYRVDGDTVRRPGIAGDAWLVGVAGVEVGHALRGALETWLIRPQVAVRFPTFYGTSTDLGLELGVTL